MTETIHIGRNIQIIRELKGMKQEALATELGISRQAVSKIEQNATIDEETLEKIADILGVNKEGIKHFNEEKVFNNINTFYNSAIQNVFNPIDKIAALYEEKIALLERLLQSEKDKCDKLEMLVKKNKSAS